MQNQIFECRRTASALALASGLMVAGGVWAAPAQATCSPGQRPCIDNIYMEGPTTLVFTWRGGQWIGDVPFQVRYRDLAEPGFLGGNIPLDNQFAVGWQDDPKWTIMNVVPGSTYLLKVQGCTSRGFAVGSCDGWSEWDEKTFTVPSPEPVPPEPPPVRSLGTAPVGKPPPYLDRQIDVSIDAPPYLDRQIDVPIDAGPDPSVSTATVFADVDVYNAKNEPDGAGQIVGVLPAATRVNLVGDCAPSSWCEVSGDSVPVPGQHGWIWGHLTFMFG